MAMRDGWSVFTPMADATKQQDHQRELLPDERAWAWVQTAGRITAYATMRTAKKTGNRIGGWYQCQLFMLQFLVGRGLKREVSRRAYF